jgi:hypothetical protein
VPLLVIGNVNNCAMQPANIIIRQAIEIAKSNLSRLETLNEGEMLQTPNYEVPVYCVNKVKLEMENIEQEIQRLIQKQMVSDTQEKVNKLMEGIDKIMNKNVTMLLMSEEDKIKYNKLISIWMGAKYSERIRGHSADSRYTVLVFEKHPEHTPEILDTDDPQEKLGYYNSWSWLMPVVEKICRLKTGDGIMIRFNGHSVFEAPSLKEATYLAVCDFVESYMKEKLTENAIS